jgi:hypothetical protein
MTDRFAIYYAPAQDAALTQRAEAWLARPDLQAETVSARRYGFHATLKAPMALNQDVEALRPALAAFAAERAPVSLGRLRPVLIDGFLALVADPQPQPITDFAGEVVEAFEAFRVPLSSDERRRRLQAPLTPRQIDLLDRFGYPYVLEEFRFHMTLTDRLADDRQGPLRAEAAEWFRACLAEPMRLDRLVLFHETEPGGVFVRLDDYPLRGNN